MLALHPPRNAALLAICMLGLSLCGCGATQHVRTGDPLIDLRSPDPIIVRQACAVAAKTGNLDAIAPLIQTLRSDDIAVRQAAITALYELFDRNLPLEFGYGWADSLERRELSVLRYEEWYNTVGKDMIAAEKARRIEEARAQNPEKTPAPTEGTPSPSSGRGS